MNEVPNALELKAMQLATRGCSEWQKKMKGQIKFLKVIRREFNGSGFVTYFHLLGDLDPVLIPRQFNGLPAKGYPPTVNAIRNIPVKGLVSFIVWLGGNGLIERLEACSLTDDLWPVDPFKGFHSFQDDSGLLLD